MKISTTQENLHQALTLVSRVTTKSTNLPILQNVLLRTQSKVLRLSTTNLELAISCLVRGRVDTEGEFTVPARLFSDYISLLPSGKVDLELVGNTLLVQSNASETKMHGIPAAEFPVIPRVTEGQVYQVPIQDLHRALQSVLFAVAQSESRPELTGVVFIFHKSEGSLTLAATDSYRLGESVIPLGKESSQEQVQVIIPAKTLVELVRVLSVPSDSIETTEYLTVTVSQNQVQFETGNTELQSRIIEGSYPDYRQIIPTQFRTEMVLPRAEFIAAIRAASLFTKNGLADVRLELVAGKPVTIRAADTQRGEHHAEVHGVVQGVENHVVVNYKYLLDGLGAMKDDEVVLKMIDGSNPCLLTPKDPEEKYQYIVMPIKQ
ncbi:MAG: DNA polymerase III subunit beta [bacterium]|nr:DNA polymerase III subunit beta [bacterium]